MMSANLKSTHYKTKHYRKMYILTTVLLPKVLLLVSCVLIKSIYTGAMQRSPMNQHLPQPTWAVMLPLQSSSHSAYGNVCSDIYLHDRCFMSVNKCRMGLEENTTVGRKGEASSSIIFTIHWTSFCDLSMIYFYVPEYCQTCWFLL